MNITREEIMPAYYEFAPNTSCALDRCLEQGTRDERLGAEVPAAAAADGKVRTMGVAIAMQSSIPYCDVGGAIPSKLTTRGHYTPADPVLPIPAAIPFWHRWQQSSGM